MTPMTLQQVADAVGAAPPSPAERVVSRVSTDTRSLRPGDLFVALRGERFDAHDHLARASSAAAAIVERVPDDVPDDLPLIVVADARRALGDLAAAHRRTLKGRVIAVAGSNGKTGTKLLVHGTLRRRRLGTVSPKSFNNDIGVPLTLLAAEQVDDYVIVECGTNHPGEIRRLREIASPDLAIITSIGHEHLEGLVDLDGVRRENLDIGDPRSTLLLNGDDSRLLEFATERGLNFTTFGFGDACDLRATDVVVGESGTSFECDGVRFTVPQLGRHAASNALAAVAVGRCFGLSTRDVRRGLASSPVPPMRLNVIDLPGGARLIDDCYNANPQSTSAALELLAALPCAGRRVAVMGDMLELGPTSPGHHAEAVHHARQVADVVVAVGPMMTTAAGSGHADSAVAAEAIASLVERGDLVLLKASRGTRLDRVADRLRGAGSLSPAA